MIEVIKTGPVDEMKSIVFNLNKNGKSESLAVKTTYLTHNVSYSNLEEEVFSLKIS